MKSFLEQVCEHYFGEDDLSSLCFVFPNRRSEAFFKKALSNAVRSSGKPAMAPGLLTMNEFFYCLSDWEPADNIHLLIKLYDCYKALYPKAESLDDFIFWGDVILSDFDDVDKYLVDPEKIFTNVADFKAIQDSFDYLSPSQEEAIRKFLSNFNGGNTGKPVKEAFLQIWKILLPLYRSFNEVLEKEGLCYEGMAYRKVADQLDTAAAVDLLDKALPSTKKIVFVGLNALNECERKLLGKLRDAQLAEFCWDYSEEDGEIISNHLNKSSLFLSKFFHEFPQAFSLERIGTLPQMKAISVPSATGQAKLLPSLLPDNSGIETAIVLPDENMLIPVLNSIPPSIGKINVTMGYPMSSSQIWALMADLAALQLHSRKNTGDGNWYFYHRQVWSIFSNSLFRSIAGEAGEKLAGDIKSSAKYYIPASDFSGNELISTIFTPVIFGDGNDIKRIEDYQQRVVATIAGKIKENPAMSIELDFAREYHLSVGRIRQYELDIKPVTYFKLQNQLLAGSAVPFKGEPLAGLQIMAPLETRALDFENLIILNCNEGMFPRKSVSSSFIPPELRKGFDLPTYEYQDAIWAYYFYRMIRRARNVTFIYDSRTEISRSGEESRYIKQLEMHFGIKVERFNASAAIGKADEENSFIEKTEDDIQVLKAHCLSASSLQSYLACPMKFYFHSVKRLKQKDEVVETVDAGILGNVLHDTMKELYKAKVYPRIITKAELMEMLADKKRIRETVDEYIKDYLHTFEISGRNIVYEDIICRYVDKVLERDLEKMGDRDHFSILGVELPKEKIIGGYRFFGRIDRLDSFEPGLVRVVDYKTGKVTDNDIDINETNAEEVAQDVFGPDNSKRPKIALQLYIYDVLVKDDFKGMQLCNTIYQTSRLFVKGADDIELCPEFCSRMEEGLQGLLEEISDLSVAWKRTEDEKTCEYCDFKTICGRI